MRRIHSDLVRFVEALPEPSFFLYSNGDVLFANAAARDLIAIRREEFERRPFQSLVIAPPERVSDYLHLCSRSKQLVPGSFTWRLVGNKSLEVRCDGMTVIPKGEAAPSLLFIRCRPKDETTSQFALLNQKIAALSKEIIERKKAERERDRLLEIERAARMDAQRISKLKDEFLSTLSHELRTPLNAMLGWAQVLLSRESLKSETRSGIAIIERNARAQKQLIEDLLDMSAIVSGRMRLDVRKVSLAAVIEAAVDSVRPAAEAKQIRLQVTLDPIAAPVKGDANRLQQVMWNLLNNAVKFTPKGGRIQVVLERVNSHLEVIVSDTGKGIEPGFLDYVFDRFRQADASATREHGGLGLGLALVKQLVELHGGAVSAKSPGAGQGATFIVKLPIMALHGEEEAKPEERVHPRANGESSSQNGAQIPSLEGITVLFVDDEADARALVEQLLGRDKALVISAGSAEEALDILRSRKIDVLISDIGMPKMDGYQFIRAVRSLPPHQGGKVPAVALTAFARSEDRTRAMLAGYTAHLAKPIDLYELSAAVATLSGRTGAA